jgi:hypothetical protein
MQMGALFQGSLQQEKSQVLAAVVITVTIHWKALFLAGVSSQAAMQAAQNP